MNPNPSSTQKPVLTEGRQAVKIREPFKPYPYASYWKSEITRLREGREALVREETTESKK